MKSQIINRHAAKPRSAMLSLSGVSAKLSMVFVFLSLGGCTQQMGGLAESEDGPVEQKASALNSCTGGDCIVYDLSTQAACTEVTEAPTQDGRWSSGLNANIDQTVKAGKVVAYQIQWFSGNWSGWYVNGVNDVDYKFNTSNSTMRRMWSYFYDHTHKYIICK